jgi:uncharacterized membrane protein HdeD (DUF308 family)
MTEELPVKQELFDSRGWIVMLRGLTAIAFGVLAIAWPDVSMRRLFVLFGLYALVHGVLSLAGAVGHRGQRGCVLLTVEGLVGLFTGIITLRTRSAAPMGLAFFVWMWALATGILRIVEAVRLRKTIAGDVWLMLSGAVTVLLGGMLILRPFIGAVGLAVMIAASALIWGLFEVLLGRELRASHRGVRRIPGPPAHTPSPL